MRRGIEIVVALIALVCLIPVFFIVIVAIILVERESPFFTQSRLGLKKKVFKIYKFRTMLNGEVTLVGKVLRKTGIDELLQLLNVLRGDMSLVGPRPLIDSDIIRLKWTGDYYQKRWSVRPGITGLAQLSFLCNRKLTWFYDKYYVEHASLCIDFRIFCLSLAVPIVGKSRVKKWIHGKT